MADTDIVQSFRDGVGKSLQSTYDEVHVMLLAWADHDLGTALQTELQGLRALFENDYKYSSVIFFPIPVDGPQRRRLNREISSFVEDQSQHRNSLIIIYYGGHCGPNEQGQAEWAAFERAGPKLPWHVTQQQLFSTRGDVLLILDCCDASLIARGDKDDGGRFELIAACAKKAATPFPGRMSFTAALIRTLKQHAEKDISSESLASKLREDPKVTETPVFHDFVRQSPTNIRLQRLDPTVAAESATDERFTAPPEGVTAVSIEAVISRAHRFQDVLQDGVFPVGSVFEGMPPSARSEIIKCMRGLNTAMANTALTAEEVTGGKDSAEFVVSNEKEVIEQSLTQIQESVSSAHAAIETPLLLGGNDDSNLGVLAADTEQVVVAADVRAVLALRHAILGDDPCRYTTELDLNKIKVTSARTSSDSRRFRYGVLEGRRVVMETYKYVELTIPDNSSSYLCDLGNPFLFGFEYARAGDSMKVVDEDHSLANNLYRHPDRWGKPLVRFEKSHDVYALGIFSGCVWRHLGMVV
ncbi:hypothetical protein QBC35DRAFT_517793 [Podospora australis]|uniref:Uncharacterized protein n=1 Tax=Podospora australis TaxID=1536484 RepID=A0AAN6WLL1_9PEZI|nr:hypothetical protein QBC35DRAFT_517793 [Podospora australis]